MKVLLSWLKEYVDIDVTPKELEEKLFSAGLEVADTATPDMCGQVIYPAAVMTCGTNQGAAKDFLDFLRAGAAKEVFERAGFTPLG